MFPQTPQWQWEPTSLVAMPTACMPMNQLTSNSVSGAANTLSHKPVLRLSSHTLTKCFFPLAQCWATCRKLRSSLSLSCEREDETHRLIQRLLSPQVLIISCHHSLHLGNWALKSFFCSSSSSKSHPLLTFVIITVHAVWLLNKYGTVHTYKMKNLSCYLEQAVGKHEIQKKAWTIHVTAATTNTASTTMIYFSNFTIIKLNFSLKHGILKEVLENSMNFKTGEEKRRGRCSLGWIKPFLTVETGQTVKSRVNDQKL